jgi:hypothetical protein
MCKEGLGFWSPSLPARPGDTHDIRYHVCGRELNPSAGKAVAAFAEFSDATGQHRQRITLPAGPASDQALTGTFAWTRLATPVNVPSGAQRMRVFLGLLPAQGQLLFDDVTIKVR